jgi:hypothetical protein
MPPVVPPRSALLTDKNPEGGTSARYAADQGFSTGRARAGTVQSQSLDRVAPSTDKKSALKKGKSPTASGLSHESSKASSSSSRVDVSRPSSPPDRRPRVGSPDTSERLASVEKSLGDVLGLLQTLVAQSAAGGSMPTSSGPTSGPRAAAAARQASRHGAGRSLGATHFKGEDRELPLPMEDEYGDDDEEEDKEDKEVNSHTAATIGELKGSGGNYRSSIESVEVEDDVKGVDDANNAESLSPVVLEEDDK